MSSPGGDEAFDKRQKGKGGFYLAEKPRQRERLLAAPNRERTRRASQIFRIFVVLTIVDNRTDGGVGQEGPSHKAIEGRPKNVPRPKAGSAGVESGRL